jgi:serine phosphatase RsbU (regulator of sigma subunit)
MKFKKKAGKKTPPLEPAANQSFDDLGLSMRTTPEVSPQNDTIWQKMLLLAALSGLAWLAELLFGRQNSLSIWITALILCTAWYLAVSILLLETKGKKFWIIVLAGSLFFVLFFSPAGRVWIAAVGFSFLFLMIRKYRPYRHLTSRRRASIFILGFMLFNLLTWGWYIGPESGLLVPEGSVQALITRVNLAGLGQGLSLFAIWSLRLFWFFTLLHIFFRIRLHFMKIRSKLAAGAFLIAFIPLVLVVLMATVVLYGTLGESRSVRAAKILEDWRVMAEKDSAFLSILSLESFRFEQGRTPQLLETHSWLEEAASSISLSEIDLSSLMGNSRAAFFLIDTDVFLLQIDRSLPYLTITGCPIDETVLERLKTIVGAEVYLSTTNPIQINLGPEGLTVSHIRDAASDEDTMTELSKDIEGAVDEPADADNSIFKPDYIGMTHIDMIRFKEGRPEKISILLYLKSDLWSFLKELFNYDNPLGQVVLALLISLGVFLLIFEAFAFYIGLRITGGITSAVKNLHRGTRRIGAGDLDTRILIPNEDELGDLAASLNSMAAAVKKGREEALAREKLERELKTAREIQERLLPDKMPKITGFEISGTSLPSLQVGGDYFDFLDLGKGYLGIAIGDVSGKGIPAALLMANLQASLHGQALEPAGVASVVSRINNLLARSTDSHMFTTFFYGTLDKVKAAFTFTNAGHNHPMLFRSDGRIERLDKGGMILGFLEDQAYEQDTISLDPGDVLVLFTDGITEARGPGNISREDVFFGEERLVEVCRRNLDKSARRIQSAILKAVVEFTRDQPQSDDITLVIIKRTLLEAQPARSTE